MIEQDVWSRNEVELGKAEQRKQKPTAQKESQRWLDSLIKTESVTPNHLQVVTIADREADFYDSYACCEHLGSDFLIRAVQNRHPTLREATLTTALSKGHFLQNLFIALIIQTHSFFKLVLALIISNPFNWT